jgi:hypothetical protein
MSSNFYTTGVRYLDKSVTGCEVALFNIWWTEQCNQYGQQILYYVSNFSLSGMDASYGEDPPAVFSDPLPIIALVNLSQTQMFSQWALLGDDFTTMVIPITGFRDVFGLSAEPKSGDVFQLSEFGEDRPGGRNGKMFEITERLDEEITQTNQLMAHMVWLIKAKRYEYTFEPGVSAEAATDQVYDNTFFGRLSGGENPPTNVKAYPGESADDYARTIFDYNSAGGVDDVYGSYS